MNIERLEMMKQMLGRVVAGSWEPVATLDQTDRLHTGLVAVEKFGLSSWVSELRVVKNTCGYVACAVGHACFDEEFRKLGLKFDGNRPVFDGKSNWDAVEKFFDLDEDTAERLFMSNRYSQVVRSGYSHIPVNVREAQMVHDRIEQLIKQAVNG